MASTFVGKINYKAKKDLNIWLTANPISELDLDGMAVESLFYKRNNFSHEKEVRLIYRTDSKSPEKMNFIKQYDISVDDFIEEITLLKNKKLQEEALSKCDFDFSKQFNTI